MLLINSVLLLRGSQRALRVDPGFDSKHLVLLSLEMLESKSLGYTQERLLQLNRRLMEEIASLPGVMEVTQASRAPVPAGNRFVQVTTDEAKPQLDREGEYQRTTVGYSYVLQNYFETLGIPVVSGRSFTAL